MDRKKAAARDTGRNGAAVEVESSMRSALAGKPAGLSTSDYLANILRERIVEGELLPGTRLIEADITRVFGVSRGPVREAVRKLTAEGLVAQEKHRSSTVRGISKDRFREIFEVRAVLEGYAAELAASRETTAEQRRWLLASRKRWAAGNLASDAQAFMAENGLLHGKLIELAANAVLAEHLRQTAIPGFKAAFSMLLKHDDLVESSAQHVAILDAVLARNTRLAHRCMAEHVHRTCEQALQRFGPDLFSRRMREIGRLSAFG